MGVKKTRSQVTVQITVTEDQRTFHNQQRPIIAAVVSFTLGIWVEEQRKFGGISK